MKICVLLLSLCQVAAFLMEVPKAGQACEIDKECADLFGAAWAVRPSFCLDVSCP